MAQLGRKTIRLKIDGTDYNDPLPRMLRRMYTLDKRRAILLKIMKKAAEPMRKAMADGAPVRTGDLKASFKIRTAKKKVGFKTLAIYVGAVNGNRTVKGEKRRLVGWRSHWAELGTRNHPGAYFIQPAIRRNIPVYQALLRRMLRNLVVQLRSQGA